MEKVTEEDGFFKLSLMGVGFFNLAEKHVAVQGLFSAFFPGGFGSSLKMRAPMGPSIPGIV